MKIVSLQSVGLARPSMNTGSTVYRPSVFKVGRGVEHPMMDSAGDPKVQSIFLKQEFAWVYKVNLDNGHQLELPADKYIAEYAPDEEEK